MSRLARALVPFFLVLGFTGCATAASPEPTTITLHITEDVPETPVEEQVPLGSVVTLQVSSEVDGLLHVHGYEQKQPLVAGGSTDLTFKASMSGVFEVETHDPDAVWIKLVVS